MADPSAWSSEMVCSFDRVSSNSAPPRRKHHMCPLPRRRLRPSAKISFSSGKGPLDPSSPRIAGSAGAVVTPCNQLRSMTLHSHNYNSDLGQRRSSMTQWREFVQGPLRHTEINKTEKLKGKKHGTCTINVSSRPQSILCKIDLYINRLGIFHRFRVFIMCEEVERYGLSVKINYFEWKFNAQFYIVHIFYIHPVLLFCREGSPPRFL